MTRRNKHRPKPAQRPRPHFTGLSGQPPSGGATTTAPPTLDDLFDQLRAGAANVAGVTYQIAVTAYLLVEGRAAQESDNDVVAVVPEGLEDIDCTLRSQGRLLVQTKERGVGARTIALAEVAQIIGHAAAALLTDTGARLAIVTNGRFGSGLPLTGRDVDLLSALGGGHESAIDLVARIQQTLPELDLEPAAAEHLLHRTHLIAVGNDVGDRTVSLLADTFEIARAGASLICAELLRDLAIVGASQRETRLQTAGSRSLNDLDLLVTRVLQDVDVPSLDEAVRAGVCEPADFVGRSPVDAATFYAGVNVTPSHIAAGLDVPRLNETSAIMDGLTLARDVVIAGPSGSGKSALLWRSAYLLTTGARVLRVLRIADADDVELLVRHVRRQRPGPGARVLVAADDLGRDQMAAWVDARRRLSEIDGVLLLASVRREDLTPGLSGNAVIVDPILDGLSAREVYRAITAAAIVPAMAVDEAVSQAKGLLMEFIALATTGRRLRAVLAEQVDAVRMDALRQDALRLVCAAHLLGSAVAADALPVALDASASEVQQVLHRLAGEHLIVSQGGEWRGLHDLRTEILFELLHEVPPPTVSATYARALQLLPAGAQGPGGRRAAVRIARRLTSDASIHPRDRLRAIQGALAPVAASLAAIAASVASADEWSDRTALHLASLLEAADRLDTVAYAHAVLAIVDTDRPPTAELDQLAGLAYSHKVDGIELALIADRIGRVAARLPARSSECAGLMAHNVGPQDLRRLAVNAAPETAIRLCEAAEIIGVVMPPDDAAKVYERHVTLPDPPGLNHSTADADRRARLTATLASLARVSGPAVATVLGPVEHRAADAVASDPFGCSVTVVLEGIDDEAEPSSNLVRRSTYQGGTLLVAKVRIFVRLGTDKDFETAYPPLASGDGTTVNGQAVIAARRVFDRCPEVDRVDIEVINADLTPIEYDGVKHLRAGVLRRPVEISRSVAFQAAVAEALGAEHWTNRLQLQATAASELLELLRELPRRLELRDNSARRRAWVRRVQETAARVANLPARPIDRGPVVGAADIGALERGAAIDDEDLRRPDRAKSAMTTIASALSQVADNLDRDARGVLLAGSRLEELPARLREARTDGAPTFAGIGQTLPEDLDIMSSLCARMLTSSLLASVQRAIRSAHGDLNAIDEAISQAAEAAARTDGDIVKGLLTTAGINARVSAVPDSQPIPVWRDQQVVVVCELEQWPNMIETLQNWSSDERELAGLSGRVTAIPADSGELLPFGLRLYGAGNILPVLTDVVDELGHALGVPMRGQTIRTAISDPCDALVAYSYQCVREQERDPSWVRVPPTAETPAQVRESLRATLNSWANRGELTDRDSFAAAAVQLVLDLCDVVEAEDPLDGLAAQVAAIDIHTLAAPVPGSAVQLLNAAQVAALEADGGST